MTNQEKEAADLLANGGKTAENVSTGTDTSAKTNTSEAIVPTTEKPKTTGGGTGGKKVEVEAKQLEGLLALVKKLGDDLEAVKKDNADMRANGLESKPRIASKVREHYVLLREVDNQIVTGFASAIYKIYDEKTREFILYVDLNLNNGKKKEKVDYLDFINNSKKVRAKIIKKDGKEIPTVEAYIQQKEASGEFGTVVTDVVVPVESIVMEFDYNIQLENGDILTLKEEALNI